MALTRRSQHSASTQRFTGSGPKFILISAAVAVICAVTVFFFLSRRERLPHVESSRQPNVQQKAETASLHSDTTPPDPPSPAKSQPPPLRQDPAIIPDNLTSTHRSNGIHSSRLISEPSDGVARTHAELLSLERQGTRTYTEFSLTRSKHFQTVGPLTVQLRKADTKHGSYDLRLTINGRQLEKKHVNLYEPIWITLNEYARPSELVVNGISKNQVWGYLSEPRNRNSELAQKRSAADRSSPKHRNP